MNIKVRTAHPSDWSDLQMLHRRASYRLPLLWWWKEYLTEDLFIVVERGPVISGAILVWPDESPVAWVRMAALDNALPVDEWLDLSLSPALHRLRQRGVQVLAWMDYGGWAGPCLRAQGFELFERVMTLENDDHFPIEIDVPDFHLRPASAEDVSAIIALDRAAFSPHWWYSKSTMQRRLAITSHFAVVEIGSNIAGYVEGETHLPRSHINRIAVHPNHQGRGIGTQLLNDALRTFQDYGTKRVTVNTQVNNHRSRRLYRRFGFEPTGDVVIAWELQL